MTGSPADGVRHFGAQEIADLVPPAEAAAAITAALRAFDPADDPARISSPLANGELLLMPSQSPAAAGIKVITVAPANPGRGLPRIQGLYVLFDATTLAPVAVLDGAALTTLRTPAVSAAFVASVAERLGADVRLVVFGGGPQGLGHVAALEAMAGVHLSHVALVVPDPSSVVLPEGLTTAPITLLASDDPGLTAELSIADVVVCATTSRTPVFDSRALRAGAVVIAVGSHEPDARELDGPCLGAATVVVEDVATALREAGDVVKAIQEGHLTPERLVTLRQLLTGEHHVDPSRAVVLKTTGMAWQDLAVAQAVVDRSRRG
jgi:ornithine cyclodeaminase